MNTLPQRIKIQQPGKLAPLLNRHRRFKILIGGRGSAKSTTIAGILVMLAYYGHKIYCLREHKTSIAKSVYPLILSQIKAHNVPGFRATNTYIERPKTGGRFDFGGIAKCIEDLKSSYGYTHFWLEEGQFISEESLRTLTPTLREKDAELWISANPKNSQDALSKRFIQPFLRDLERYGYYEDDLHLIIKVNYYDNDWFPESLEDERRFDKTFMSRAMYDHVWLGAFNDSVEDGIIQAEWVDAAINCHERLGIKPTGAIVCAHDPSDLGPDEKALCVRHGILIKHAESKNIMDVNTGCDWATTTAIQSNADLFIWDAGGMGLGLKRQVNDTFRGKKIRYKPFRGEEKPDFENQIYEPVGDEEKKPKKNKDVFYNKRAQYYWYLRDRFFNTYLAVEKGIYIDPDQLISISPDIKDLPLLRSEVCRIPRIYNAHGKIQIMPKKMMETRLKIQSPNIADSIMMSFLYDEPMATDEPLVFDSYY